MGVDEHNFVFDHLSGQNQILSPIYNSNRGIVTITMWCQNLIFTTKTFKNRCLGIYRSKNAKTSISDSFSGQNPILTPHYNSNYTPITIVKWAQNLILITKMF